jgi:hypothetical protein
MTNLRFANPAALRWLCCLAALTVAARPAQGQGDDDWTRHFRVGTQIGLNIKADFSMSSGSFQISGKQPGIYDDGYVLVDQTGNAQGYTSYWGYQNPSQYDPVSQTLSMHSATSFTYSGGGASGGFAPYVGFDMAYGGNLFRWGRTQIGWELGFGLLPIEIEDAHPLTVTVTRTVQSFNTGGIFMPTAPYNGGPSGIGPTIVDTATAQPDDTVGGTVTGSRTLDVTLYNIRLGPTVYRPLGRRLAVEASGGFALGVVSGDYKFDETIVLADGSSAVNTWKIGATDVVYGGYVNAVLLYHVVPNGDIYLGAQFMPLGNASVSSGGRQARLNLGSGVYFSGGINWPF